MTTRPGAPSTTARWVAVGLAGVLGLSLAAIAGSPSAMVEALRDDRAGLLAYALVYVVLNVAFVPATLLTAGAGYLGGPVAGLILSVLCRNVAAATGFILSRELTGTRFERLCARRPGLAAFDGALTDGGTRLVILQRLSPLMPSTVSSWALGATSLRLRDFVIGTAVGTLPATILWVLAGAWARDAGALRGATPPAAAHSAALAAGVLATVILVVWMGILARRRLAALPNRNAQAGIDVPLARDGGRSRDQLNDIS